MRVEAGRLDLEEFHATVMSELQTAKESETNMGSDILMDEDEKDDW